MYVPLDTYIAFPLISVPVGVGEENLVVTPVVSDKLVATLPSWGPSFRLYVELYIDSFDGDFLSPYAGDWAYILRVTSTDQHCCDAEDRIPAIQTNKNGYIHISTNIYSAAKSYDLYLNEKTWYGVEILQFKDSHGSVITPFC